MTSIYLYPHEPLNRINPYYALFHDALEDHGFRCVGKLWVNDGWVKSTPARGDVLLFHWNLEFIWRDRGLRPDRQVRELVGFWRYLRLARRCGVTVAWVVHDMYELKRWNLFDRIGYGILASAAQLCVVHSNAALSEFTFRYPQAAKKCMMFGIGNYDGTYPTPRPAATTRAALNLPPVGRLLVACGMVRPYKGFETAIDAVGRLPAGYHLLIAGHPNNREYARELTARIGGRSDITFLDRSLTDQEFADVYNAADCVLLPYHMITGSGALHAAFTFGRGVVASDLPYFRELLTDGPDAGVLVPPNDAVALVAGIEEFFAGDVPGRHAAARRIADRYPWSEVIRPFVERLRQLTPVSDPNLSGATK